MRVTFDRYGNFIRCLRSFIRPNNYLGDFNARTGDLIDYTETSNDLTIYHDSVSEPLKSQRLNPDKKVNSYGRELIDLCQGTDLQILNGRGNDHPPTNNFTCFKRKGKSVVDYLIANSSTAALIHNFKINERRADSDHAALSYEIKFPINVRINTKCQFKITKYHWNPDSQYAYINAFGEPESLTYYHNFFWKYNQLWIRTTWCVLII